MASVFSKIIAGEIPCYRVYEDEYVIAFLDIHPIEAGHTLIVPKVEVDHFYEVPEPYYSAVFAAARLLAPAIRAATGSERVATLTLGWDVPHFHYHLIPLFERGGFDMMHTQTLSDERMREMVAAIVARVGEI